MEGYYATTVVFCKKVLLLGIGEENIETGARIPFGHYVFPAQHAGQVRLERFIHHVIHNRARRIKRTSLLADGGFGFLIVRGEQIFKYLAKQFRIKSDFLIDGNVFVNGELVVREDMKQPAGFFRTAPPFPGDYADINLAFTEEESIRDKRSFLRGRDIKRYGYSFADIYLIASHNEYINSNGNWVSYIDMNDYSTVRQHLDFFEPRLSRRADQGNTPYNLRSCAYMNLGFG